MASLSQPRPPPLQQHQQQAQAHLAPAAQLVQQAIKQYPACQHADALPGWRVSGLMRAKPHLVTALLALPLSPAAVQQDPAAVVKLLAMTQQVMSYADAPQVAVTLHIVADAVMRQLLCQQQQLAAQEALQVQQ